MAFRTREKEIEGTTGSGGAPSGPAGGDLADNYPNPQVLDDSHSHTDATIEFPHDDILFDFSSAPSLILKALAVGDFTKELVVKVTTPFDPGVVISIGFPSNPTAIAAVGKVNLQNVGEYKFSPYRRSVINENLMLYFSGVAPTQGSGVIFLDL